MIQELGILGKKLGMTQLFDENGEIVPVTMIQIAENVITEIKTVEKDGYAAVQIGSFATKPERLSRPERVRLEKKSIAPFRKLKEFRPKGAITGLNVGDAIDIEAFFKDTKKVNITGTTIGKGFQGGIKLHNMSRGFRSHGSKSIRIIGSIGAHTEPGRVIPGKRMPAMMGNETQTSKLKFFKYDSENRVLMVRGPVPGKPGAVVTIKPFGLTKWNSRAV